MGPITQEIQDFVNTTKLGFIATVCPDGTPNLSPKGTTMSWDEEHLVFADIHSPETIKNLLLNPAIEINIVDVFIRKGYRFKGIATVYSEGPVFQEVFDRNKEFLSKYPIRHIVLVKVDRVLRLISPAYDDGTSEAEVKSRWIDYWQSLYNKE